MPFVIPIHNSRDRNPHVHILLTLRALDEKGKWRPKSYITYPTDENGDRIRLPSGRWKTEKHNTTDWNDPNNVSLWRDAWAALQNRYLAEVGSPIRVDLRSYEKQGIDKIPTVHEGPAVRALEKRGVRTDVGNLNREIGRVNAILTEIGRLIGELKTRIDDLREKREILRELWEERKEPTLSDFLLQVQRRREDERTDWSPNAKLNGTMKDFNELMAVKRPPHGIFLIGRECREVSAKRTRVAEALFHRTQARSSR